MSETVRVSVEEFFTELAKGRDEDAGLVGTYRVGDPELTTFKNGKPRGWPSERVDRRWVQRHIDDNMYVAVSSFAPTAGQYGEYWARKREHFRAAHVLMIDDVGVGRGSKAGLAKVEAFPPTCLVESSPANFQALYFFEEPLRDEQTFIRLTSAVVTGLFEGKDPGMKGSTRVFRPPFGINGKAKYRDANSEPWRVRARIWNPERRFTVQGLLDAFEIRLAPPPPRPRKVTPSEALERVIIFEEVFAEMRSRGLLLNERFEPDTRVSFEDLPAQEGGKWMPIQCPFLDDHGATTEVKKRTRERLISGTYLHEPDELNGWCGLVRCWHGSCIDRKWPDFLKADEGRMFKDALLRAEARIDDENKRVHDAAAARHQQYLDHGEWND